MIKTENPKDNNISAPKDNTDPEKEKQIAFIKEKYGDYFGNWDTLTGLEIFFFEEIYILKNLHYLIIEKNIIHLMN